MNTFFMGIFIFFGGSLIGMILMAVLFIGKKSDVEIEHLKKKNYFKDTEIKKNLVDD